MHTIIMIRIARFLVTGVHGTTVTVIAVHRRMGAFARDPVAHILGTHISVIAFRFVFTSDHRITTVNRTRVAIIAILGRMQTSTRSRVADVVGTGIVVITVHGRFKNTTYSYDRILGFCWKGFKLEIRRY